MIRKALPFIVTGAMIVAAVGVVLATSEGDPESSASLEDPAEAGCGQVWVRLEHNASIGRLETILDELGLSTGIEGSGRDQASDPRSAFAVSVPQGEERSWVSRLERYSEIERATACSRFGLTIPQPTATSGPPTATPTTTGTATPTATLVPLPTLGPTAGTFAYLLDGDLWLAALDGSSPAVQLTDDAECVQYAGWSRDEGGRISVFYVTQRREADGQDTLEVFDVYRVSLAGDNPEKVFEYRGACPGFGTSANVSRDGRRIAYVDHVGLGFHDLETGTVGRLTFNRACGVPPDGIADCASYSGPVWSPSGDALLVSKAGYEGAISVIIELSEAERRITEIRFGGFGAAWAPDGERLCVTEFTYGNTGSLLIYDVSTGETTDALASLDLPRSEAGFPQWNSSGCVWAASGELAVPFVTFTDDSGAQLVVLDDDVRPISQIDLGERRLSLVDWLSESSRIVMNRSDRLAEPLGVVIVGLDGSMRQPPFAADRALGVIP